MKIRTWVIAGLVMLTVLPLAAQPSEEKMAQIEAIKVGFITRKLNLTSEEAQVFWPVYNEYADKKKEQHKAVRKSMMEARLNFDDLSDEELNELVDGMIDQKQAEVDLLREYRGKFAKVLPPRKVALLFKAEHEFQQKVREIMRERGGPGHGKGGPGGRGGPGGMRGPHGF